MDEFLDKPVSKREVISTLCYVGAVWIWSGLVKDVINDHKEKKLDRKWKKAQKEAYDKKYPNGSI